MDARRFTLVLTVVASMFFAAAGYAQPPTPKKNTSDSPKKTTAVAVAKSASSESSSKSVAATSTATDLRKPEKPSARKLLTLSQPFLLNLKYDTSSKNLECRCYDFRANLPANKVMVLNFFSAKKYNVESPQ